MKRIESRVARLRRVAEASDDGQPALTIARARDLLDDYPEDATSWMFLGIALTDLARYDEAEEAFRRAIRHAAPGALWSMYAEMGHHHKARGAFKRAAAWYRKAIAAAPEEGTTHCLLGDMLYYMGRLGESEGAYRAAIDCPEGVKHEIWLNLGLVLRAQDRLVEAAECFKHALKLKPEYEPATDALKDVRATFAFHKRKGS